VDGRFYNQRKVLTHLRPYDLISHPDQFQGLEKISLLTESIDSAFFHGASLGEFPLALTCPMEKVIL